jgi:hypothetical protein
MTEEEATWAWLMQRLSWVRFYSSMVMTIEILELQPALVAMFI